ncbi:MAG: hypothetical protein ACKN9P_07460 [Phenylobacterium sp.]
MRRRPGTPEGLCLFLVLASAACSPAGAPPDAGASRKDEAAYLPPPQVTGVSPRAGLTRLEGRSPGGARVRLASPGGTELVARADAAGRWTLEVPGEGQPRVFGLSQAIDGRTTQAEGYVFLAPDGSAWLLRSGGAARPLGPAPARGLVVDYDRSGGTVVSGAGPANALLVAQIDGRRAGEGRVNAAGRFEIRLNGPAPMGESRLRVFGEGLNLETRLRLSPPAPPESGPVRSQDRGEGLRIDWMTPAGGVQTTQILP